MKVATDTGVKGAVRGYLTVAQTCRRLDRSRWTIARLINNETLKAEKRGTARNAQVLITERSVREYEASIAVPPAEEN